VVISRNDQGSPQI